MNVNEALEVTLGKLKELENLGATVVIVPSRSRESEKIKKQCEGNPRRLDPSNWYHATIVCKTQAQVTRMWDMRKELRELGIGFDSGGGCCAGLDNNGSNFGYDWELDYSFNVDEDERAEISKSN